MRIDRIRICNTVWKYILHEGPTWVEEEDEADLLLLWLRGRHQGGEDYSWILR